MGLTSTLLPYGVAFFCAAVVAAYLYLTRNFDHWRKKGVTQVKSLPFIGSLKEVVLMKKNMGLLAKGVYEKHKKEPFIGLFAFDRPMLQIHDLEIVKAILVKDFQYFCDRSVTTNEEVDPLPGKSLFGLKGERWRHARNAISPSFTSGKMKRMFDIISECGKLLASTIEKEKCTGKPVAVYDLASRYTSDVIATCAFGIQGNTLADSNAEFRRILRKHFEFSIKRSLLVVTAFFAPKLLKLIGGKVILPEVENFIINTITNTVKEREKLNIKRNDLLDCLIQLKTSGSIIDEEEESIPKTLDKVDIGYEDICAHSFAFLVAGMESSANTMSFMLFELARNEDVQDKLRSEIKEVSAEGLSYEKIHGMKYLDMVMKETLRKYPPLPFIERKSNKTYTLPGTKVILEEGSSVMIPVLGFHHDPEFYPNPQLFDPERFSEENKQNILNYTYMPFGEGPRNCIGMRFAQLQTKTAIANLLLNYSVHQCSNTPEEIEYNPRNFLLQPKNKIELILKQISM